MQSDFVPLASYLKNIHIVANRQVSNALRAVYRLDSGDRWTTVVYRFQC